MSDRSMAVGWVRLSDEEIEEALSLIQGVILPISEHQIKELKKAWMSAE